MGAILMIKISRSLAKVFGLWASRGSLIFRSSQCATILATLEAEMDLSEPFVTHEQWQPRQKRPFVSYSEGIYEQMAALAVSGYRLIDRDEAAEVDGTAEVTSAMKKERSRADTAAGMSVAGRATFEKGFKVSLTGAASQPDLVTYLQVEPHGLLMQESTKGRYTPCHRN
jgi:hypothetical protein